ncbi:hypothetical protein bcgnr5413_58590 [Bacillus cereus]
MKVLNSLLGWDDLTLVCNCLFDAEDEGTACLVVVSVPCFEPFFLPMRCSYEIPVPGKEVVIRDPEGPVLIRAPLTPALTPTPL